MLSGSSKNFHIIVSDLKIVFASLEALIASGKRDISHKQYLVRFRNLLARLVNIKTSISLSIELF
jgi:hypothetical protein